MTTKPTSGQHGLAAEQLLAQSRQPDIDMYARMLFIGASITQALLSVSGQLGEIIAWANGDEDLADEDLADTEQPDVGPLVPCGAVNARYPMLVCCKPAGHPADVPHGGMPHGGMPHGNGIMITWHDSDNPPSWTPIGDELEREVANGEPLPVRTPGAFLAAPDGDPGTVSHG